MQWPTTGSATASVAFGYNDLQQMNSTALSVGTETRWAYGMQYDQLVGCATNIAKCNNNGNVLQTVGAIRGSGGAYAELLL